MALAAQGHEVSVICSHPMYPHWKPCTFDLPLEGVKTFRGGSWLLYPRSVLLRRLILECWFAFHVLVTSSRLGHVDTVIAVFPPSLFFLFGNLLFGRSFKIGIVHDLQGIHAGRDSFLRRLAARIVHLVESKSFGACHRLIYLSNDMADSATRAYALQEKSVTVVYPFVTIDDVVRTSSLSEILSDDTQHVIYSGALSEKQNPLGLIQFFNVAATRMPEVRFHIFSAGPWYQRLRDENRTSHIAFHPLVRETELEELYARSAVQVIPQSPGTSAGCLPSKLPNILASGTRILCICDDGSELAGILQLVEGAAVEHQWDAELLTKRLRSLLEETKEQTHAKRKASSSNLLRERFSIEALLQAVTDQRNTS